MIYILSEFVHILHSMVPKAHRFITHLQYFRLCGMNCLREKNHGPIISIFNKPQNTAMVLQSQVCKKRGWKLVTLQSKRWFDLEKGHYTHQLNFATLSTLIKPKLGYLDTNIRTFDTLHKNILLELTIMERVTW